MIIMALVTGSVMLPASAGATTVATIPIHYVALGDSYSAGVGTRKYLPESGTCMRSPDAYPELWAQAHDPATFTFVACDGATTAQVEQNQISALNSETTLVTVSVGGNDVGFTSVLTHCLLLSEVGCRDAVDKAEQAVRDQLPAKLDATYAKIRAAAPHAKVIVVGYPELNSLGTCSIPGYTDAKRAAINEGADLLASVISSRAAAAGFSYADPRPAFQGHGVCSSAAWINGPTSPVWNSFHPTVEGQSDGYLPTVDAITG
jgi:lysophospholipase L1-like esterase